MKKLLFIIHFGNIKKSSGIIEKVYNQSNAMHKLGIHYKTYILFKKEEEEDVKIFPKVDYIEFVPLSFFKKERTLIKNYIVIQKIYKEYCKICEREKSNYDYIYVRFNALYLGFVYFVEKFKNKIIFEHNSIEISEYKANKSTIKVINSKIFDKFTRRKAAGYVCVTKEIYDYQKKLYNDKKGIIITNGINVRSFKFRNIPKYDMKNINLIFVGNIRYWHGLERIIESLKNYKGKIKISFNICGLVNQDDDFLTPLVENVNKENKNVNIKLLGYKFKEEMNSLYDKAHLAVGCLGGYKKNIEYASVLKNREYFSRGIPIIFSEIDEDICVKENEGLYLKVPNNDSKIDFNRIIEFIDDFYKDPIKNSKKIREFAEKKLDYESKITKLKVLIDEMDK